MITPKSCSSLKSGRGGSSSGNYTIDPDGKGGVEPFSVYCDMSDKGGVGVTVMSHDRESGAHVVHIPGCGVTPGCYCCHRKDVSYTGVSTAQSAALTLVLQLKPVNSLLNLSVKMMLPLCQSQLPGGCHVMEEK